MLFILCNSLHHKILINREQQGKVENKKNLDQLLSSAISNTIDSLKTIVIIYYPGKDPCNSSGKASYSSRKAWFGELEKKLFKITQTKPIYIYKNKEGTEKYDSIMDWFQDPNQTIEKLFFSRHYPCTSFVVISKSGRFYSYFGEFSKENLLNIAELFTGK